MLDEKYHEQIPPKTKKAKRYRALLDIFYQSFDYSDEEPLSWEIALVPDVDTCPCPSCRRSNASFRASCLYCGVSMPSPTPRPEPQQKTQTHPDFDQLVRQALAGKGGGLSQLKKALKRRPPQKSTRVSASDAPPKLRQPQLRSVPNPQDLPQDRQLTAKPPNTASKNSHIEMLMEEMVDLIHNAQRALKKGQVASSRRSLTDVKMRLDSAISALSSNPVDVSLSQMPSITTVAEVIKAEPEPQETMPIELPPQRSAFLLTVDGPGDRELGPSLASALKIDGATARMHVIARHPRAIIRSDEQTKLESLASRVRRDTSLFATVLSRQNLLECSPPKMVVSGKGRVWQTTPTPLWLMEIDPSSTPSGTPSPAPRPAIIVPGTVVIRRYAAQNIQNSRMKKRGFGAQREATERRLQVIDIYQKEGQSFRVVLGLTRLEGLPGYVPSSALQSMKGLVAALGAPPNVQVIGPKTCHPWQQVNTGLGASTEERVVSGWPVWEEHSRLCLLHLMKNRPSLSAHAL